MRKQKLTLLNFSLLFFTLQFFISCEGGVTDLFFSDTEVRDIDSGSVVLYLNRGYNFRDKTIRATGGNVKESADFYLYFDNTKIGADNYQIGTPLRASIVKLSGTKLSDISFLPPYSSGAYSETLTATSSGVYGVYTKEGLYAAISIDIFKATGALATTYAEISWKINYAGVPEFK